MKIAVVVNPRSAGGRTGERWAELRDVLLTELGSFDDLQTQAPGDGTRLSREALRGGADLVVALGGDGTVNEVMNGFFDGTERVRPTAAFAVISAGTGGDFVKTLQQGKALARAAADVKAATPRAIDVGRLTFTTHSGEQAMRHFLNIASFGLSGRVVKYANESSKALGGKVSFALATLRAGIGYKNPNVRLTLDSDAPREGKIYTVAVANGRFFGGGMMVAPHAQLDDGQFDVVTMGDFGLADLLLRGLDIYSGKHLSNPKVDVQRARRVVAEPLEPGAEILIDLDGEGPGRLPATFELLDKALLLRSP